ncbi:hypothetical protein AAFF_G00028010 [Aldrovandia affinis]|uniref:Uncharacterized protein n=1 Tax=Aldrovandia affinis TaxID=143900 RepID=A0AAD7VY33_9TELE|nr:hypothetical protein AAFF_G00028010 [Aldrovandia affinis]
MPEGTHSIARLGTASAVYRCEGAGGSAGTTIPCQQTGEDPGSGDYVGDSPDEETAPTGRGAVIRSLYIMRAGDLSSRNDPHGVQNTWVDENIYTEYIRKMD